MAAQAQTDEDFYNKPRSVQLFKFLDEKDAKPKVETMMDLAKLAVKDIKDGVRSLGVGAGVSKPSNPKRPCVFDHVSLQKILYHESVRDVQVVVICLAGGFRTGKSFLLNFMLRYLNALPNVPGSDGCDTKWETKDGLMPENSSHSWIGDNAKEADEGFDWRIGSKSHTEGIWAWSRAIRVRQNGKHYAIVLLDTQGTSDLKASLRETTTMFALSSLLSSVMIFNIRGVIGSDVLQLHVFVEYGKKASNKLCEYNYNSSESVPLYAVDCFGDQALYQPVQSTFHHANVRPFQELTFLVRDWMSPADHQYGFSQTYLHETLDINGAGGRQFDSETREVAKYLTECFDVVNCFLLPYPGECVTEPEYRGQFEHMSTKFKIFMPQLVESLLNTSLSQPKRIGNSTVTCAQLCKFAISGAATLSDSSNLPSAASWFETYWQGVNRFAIECGLEAYDDHMMALTLQTSGKLSDADFRALHKRAAEKACVEFERQELWGPPIAINDCRRDFEDSLVSRKQRLMNINAERTDPRENLATIFEAELEKKRQDEAAAASKPWFSRCTIL